MSNDTLRPAEDPTGAAHADTDHWTRVAQQWIAWARAPGHDAFWSYRDAFAAFVGQAPQGAPNEVLEVGCGEGRISRELKALGYHVTASDGVRAMVEAATAADSAHAYAVAPATRLPFERGQFDTVVAYNVLMDVEDVTGAYVEMRRVLRDTGTLIVSLVHPFADRGRFTSRDADAPFVVSGSYFGRERFEGVYERGGMQMHFAGWSQTLEAYAMAFEHAGLAITSLREPQPTFAESAKDMQQWTRMPMFLWLKARPLA